MFGDNFIGVIICVEYYIFIHIILYDIMYFIILTDILKVLIKKK